MLFVSSTSTVTRGVILFVLLGLILMEFVGARFAALYHKRAFAREGSYPASQSAGHASTVTAG
jgi:hypothetical protein